ncbi:Cytochrome P450 CYP682N1 [Acrodontium crateriforme]|uniref:Cytochrome P450 CYP682N1 n=1 Tax=Acrodontium crateriforme TaxID=150365 RepID=A0AAQ3MBU8_9PEZI|nr:Cytochrome P450 CYP682N1 [Acrodontium crateriforme]
MDSISVIPLIITALLLYISVGAVRRLYFSRISHVPGPKLAALTYLYQRYWDVWPCSGQFMFHTIELHKRYGPIVRVGPDEVHIDDASFYSECYPSSIIRRRDKSPLQFGWYQGTGEFSDGSSFSTLANQLHRSRRAGIAPFFSKQMVRDLEPRVKDKVLRLRAALLRHSKAIHKEEQLVDMNNAMSALTMDVISEYAFGRSIGALDRPDLAKPYNDALRESMKIHPFGRAFPALARNLIYLPQWITNHSPLLVASEGFQNIVKDLSTKAFADAHNTDTRGKRTVLHSILQSPEVPESEKTFPRINAEGVILFGAGTETTGRTLAITILHILADPSIHARLLEELRPLIPSYQAPLPPVSQLEALPFLTAVINEGLRMGHGACGRLSRIAPDENLVFPNGLKGPVIIPAGTTFSQSSYLIHTNQEIYPDPFNFRPERFLSSENATDAENEAVNRAKANLVPFGRGTRACVGLNLAYSELYLPWLQ